MSFFNYNKFFFYKLYEKTQINKAILRKKNRAGEIRFPDLTLYCKATVVNMVWYYQKKQEKKKKIIRTG